MMNEEKFADVLVLLLRLECDSIKREMKLASQLDDWTSQRPILERLIGRSELAVRICQVFNQHGIEQMEEIEANFAQLAKQIEKL